MRLEKQAYKFDADYQQVAMAVQDIIQHSLTWRKNQLCLAIMQQQNLIFWTLHNVLVLCNDTSNSDLSNFWMYQCPNKSFPRWHSHRCDDVLLTQPGDNDIIKKRTRRPQGVHVIRRQPKNKTEFIYFWCSHVQKIVRYVDKITLVCVVGNRNIRLALQIMM